jgi:hypothetical protein
MSATHGNAYAPENRRVRAKDFMFDVVFNRQDKNRKKERIGRRPTNSVGEAQT